MSAAATPILTAHGVSHEIIKAALQVHSALGPGLLESAYEACLRHELQKARLHVQSQVALPVIYDTVKLDLGYRLDFVVEDLVIVEVKSFEALTPVHQAQLLSYLKLSGKSLGLLINFNVAHLKEGIKRMVVGHKLEVTLQSFVSLHLSKIATNLEFSCGS